MDKLQLGPREVAMWDRNGQDVDFFSPLLEEARKDYPSLDNDREDVLDHMQQAVRELRAEDSDKYISKTRRIKGRGEVVEVTDEGSKALGSRLGLIHSSREPGSGR